MQRCIMTFSANDSQHVAPTLSLMQASETAVFRAQSDRVTTRIIDGDPHRFSNIGGERHANCRAPPDYHMLEGLYHTCRNRRIIFNVAALHTISFVLATEDETPKLEHVPTAHCHNDSSAVQWYCSPHLSSGIGLPRLTLPAVNHRCGTRVDASRLLHFLKVNRDFLTFAGSAASPSITIWSAPKTASGLRLNCYHHGIDAHAGQYVRLLGCIQRSPTKPTHRAIQAPVVGHYEICPCSSRQCNESTVKR